MCEDQHRDIYGRLREIENIVTNHIATCQARDRVVDKAVEQVEKLHVKVTATLLLMGGLVTAATIVIQILGVMYGR